MANPNSPPPKTSWLTSKPKNIAIAASTIKMAINPCPSLDNGVTNDCALPFDYLCQILVDNILTTSIIFRAKSATTNSNATENRSLSRIEYGFRNAI